MSHQAPASSAASSLSTPRIPSNPWVVLVVLTFGFFMILLDTTIVNVAIPSIITALHASLDQILWVLNAYILVYAILLIVSGRLGDMFGPKRMFMTGLVVFTLSSIACGLAQSSEQLILFRVIQGVGGAILTPQSLSLITTLFPPEKRGAAFGVWGGVAGIAAVAGPTLGGFLTTTFSWRAIFYVNVPIGIIAVILAYLLMPELTIHRKHHLDMVGVLLAMSGLFAGVFGLIEGERYSWGRISDLAAIDLGSLHLGLLSIPTILLTSVVLLALFLRWEASQEEPLLPLSLFRDRNFSLANLVQTFVAFAMLGLFLPLTIFFQSVLGFSAERAGIAIAPMSLTMMVVAPFAGRLTDKVNGKWILATGMTLYAIGMTLIVLVSSLSSTALSFTLPLVIAGIGMGCTFAPLTTLAMRDIGPTQAGAASGFLNTIRQVGGVIGSTVVGAVLQNRLGAELHSQAVRYGAQLPVKFRGGFVAGFSHAASSGLRVGRGQTGGGHLPTNLPASMAHQLASLGQQVFDHGFLNAMKPSLAIPIASMLLGATIATLMRPSPAKARQAAAEQSRSGVVAAGE